MCDNADKVGMDRFRIPIAALGGENDAQSFVHLSPGAANCSMKQQRQRSVILQHNPKGDYDGTTCL